MAADGGRLARAVAGVGRRVAGWLRPRLDPRAPAGELAPEVLDTLRAYAEAVLDERPLDDAEWEPLREALVARARTCPGYRLVCDAACRLLDRAARGRFAALPIATRARCVRAHGLAARPVHRRELLSPWRRTAIALRTFVLPEILVAYYESAAGWAVVGYQAPLGGCRDLLEYTRPMA